MVACRGTSNNLHSRLTKGTLQRDSLTQHVPSRLPPSEGSRRRDRVNSNLAAALHTLETRPCTDHDLCGAPLFRGWPPDRAAAFPCACLAGKLCVEVSAADKVAFLSEELCIGCGICVKVSPLRSLRAQTQGLGERKRKIHRTKLHSSVRKDTGTLPQLLWSGIRWQPLPEARRH